MSWVVRFKEFLRAGVIRRVAIIYMAFISAFITLARAVTPDTRVYPMYGVAYPVVKYGPPVPTTPHMLPGIQPIDWSSLLSQPWAYVRQPMNISVPGTGQWSPSIPSLLGIAAGTALILLAVCGWTARGSVWYLKNRDKK